MRPTSQRVLTVLFAVLLATTMLAPAFAGSAVAQDDQLTDTVSCEDDANAFTNPVIWMGQYVCQAAADETDTSQSASAVKTDLHHMMVSEWESQEAYLSVTNNYLEDTDTIASLEAKHAIATAWENNETASQAAQNGREAIRDYYTMQQIQMLNTFEKQMAQASYVHNVSKEHPEIDRGFLGIHITDGENIGYDSNLETMSWTDVYYNGGEQDTVEVQLVNGSVENVTTNLLSVEYEDGGSNSYPYNVTYAVEPFETWEKTDGILKSPAKPGGEYDRDAYFNTSGAYSVFNVGDAAETGLESQRVADLYEWRQAWDALKTQEQTLTSNYDDSFAQDLYAELDAGAIDPQDVRGSEGTVRFMSGDDNVTGQRYRLATLSALGIDNPDMTNASTMVVEYEGYTGQSFNDEPNGTDRTVEYHDHVNETYQGLLFSTETPADGFQAGTTYNTDTLGGSQVMFDEENGTEVNFYKGNFTITSMYDSEGNEVENVDWEEPKYDTYNATEYIEYVNKSTVYRNTTIINEGTTGGGGINLPGWIESPDIGTGGIVAGLGVIVAVLLAAFVAARNVLP